MANTRSAEKQARVSIRRGLRNQVVTSRLRRAERRLRELAKAKDKAAADQLKQVFSLADRAVKAKVISKNAASRKKSRLSALLITK